jgi:hypothetical protein
MVSVCLSAVYLGPELRLGQTIKTTCIKIGLCYFPAKQNFRSVDVKYMYMWRLSLEKNVTGLVMVMVFNATFNNISVISWRSVLLTLKHKFLSYWNNIKQNQGESGKLSNSLDIHRHVAFLKCPLKFACMDFEMALDSKSHV